MRRQTPEWMSTQASVVVALVLFSSSALSQQGHAARPIDEDGAIRVGIATWWQAKHQSQPHCVATLLKSQNYNGNRTIVVFRKDEAEYDQAQILAKASVLDASRDGFWVLDKRSLRDSRGRESVCVGSKNLIDVEAYTIPAVRAGVNVTFATIRFRLDDLPAWAKHLDFQAIFPEFAPVSYLKSVMLTQTNRGWECRLECEP